MAKVQKKAQTAHEAQDFKVVNALNFLKTLNLEWVLNRPLDEGDIDTLKAAVNASDNGAEWASWWLPYTRVDGTPVPGLGWGVSAPMGGGFIILRLVEGGEVKATLKVYSNGKGVLTGSKPIVQALSNRPDLKEWTDEDTAKLLV